MLQLCRQKFNQRPTFFPFLNQKWWKNLNLANFSFCLKKFHWIYRVQFCQFRRKSQQKSVKFSLTVRKWWKNLIFTKKFPSTFPTNMGVWRSDNSAANEGIESRTFFAYSPKLMRKDFLTRSFSLNMFPLTQKVHSWPPFRRIWSKSRKVFAQSPIKVKKIFAQNNYFSSKWSYGHKAWSFVNPAKKNFQKRPKFFRSLS